MKTICLYFEIHQIIHLKRYRCFDIGRDHYYYDDYENERGISDIAERSYIPALSALIEMAKNHGDTFKVALSISGVALEQLEVHAPGVIELLHQLNETGCCEFLCEPYSHGLSSLANEDCFREEVERMRTKIKQIFGKEPKVFRNSSLIYSNDIGATIADMGFKGMLTEGAKHILGWKSPHYLYHCAMNPNLKLLLRDFKLSDDISLRFSNSEWNEYPLFADKYIDWIAALPEEEQVINIFMELSALGIAQPLSSNILEFMKALPVCAKERGVTFSTPTDIITKLKSVDQVDVPYPMSWIDEERDISPWLGNVMQREAFNKLYSVAERVHLCDDRRIKQDWDYLQASNNFRFMTTKNTGIWLNRGIYDSPYDAFTNYMNVLGDFCYISVGMVVNANEKNAQGAFKKEDLISDSYDAIHCRKYIEAKDIDKFQVKRVRYLEWNTERCPDKLRRPTFRELYDCPKLLINRLGVLKVYLDMDTHFLHSDSMFCAVLWKDLKGVYNKSLSSSIKKFCKHNRAAMESLSEKVDLYYLLGILNSSMADQLLADQRGGDYHIYPEHIRNLPIPVPQRETQDAIGKIAKEILHRCETNTDYSELEEQLNRLVAVLYQ